MCENKEKLRKLGFFSLEKRRVGEYLSSDADVEVIKKVEAGPFC